MSVKTVMTAIREDNIVEELNPNHIARAWEEGTFTVDATDGSGFPPGTHSYTNLMFSCGLVVRYKGFIQKD